MAYLAHLDASPPVVIALGTDTGGVITDPELITTMFADFFQNVYTSKVDYPPRALCKLIDSLVFPTLTEIQVAMLEAPISADDIQFAIAKAPGLDGLPIEFYAHFVYVLVPKSLTLYHAIFDANVLPESMREALIVLIPKSGKDPLQPEAYRPISLLQTDVKLWAKILALHLSKVVMSLVHPDQTGFMSAKPLTPGVYL